MPELARYADVDTDGDSLVVRGDLPGHDPCVSIVAIEQATRASTVILSRSDVASLVVTLDAWLQSTAKDTAAQYERTADEASTYPEAVPSVTVPDYDAPSETGRAVRLSSADGFVFIECGRESVTAVKGDASARTFKVEGSVGVEANDLIRALAHLLPLTPGLEVGVVTAR